MKHLLTLLFILALAPAISAQFTCDNPERVYRPAPAALLASVPDDVLCSTVFVQVDADIVADKGLEGARRYAESLMENAETPYTKARIDLSFNYQFLESEIYTDGSSFDLLQQFQENTPVFDGDVALLISYKARGSGVAWVDVACRPSVPYRYGFANISPTFKDYADGYSWSVMVVAHELGHTYGSPHTQDCAWRVNGVEGMAIDGCVTGGGCGSGPIPADGGTIMSYCHMNQVGINFDKGFHPQVAALIRANVYGRCVTCDAPNEPEPPVVVACKENTVFLDLILDAYPTETSYQVTDKTGAVIHRSPPFVRGQVGEVVNDTLCLPDGCYTYTISDSTGLYSLPCAEGYYYVGDAFGEFASGQDFAGEVSVNFCVGDVSEDCDRPDLVAANFVSYSNQDADNGIVQDGRGIILKNNTWVAMPYQYEVGASTVVTGEIWVETSGEIHGIGLVKNIEATAANLVFRLAGSQKWGVEADQVETGSWQTFEIKVGEEIPVGTYSYLVLANDHDQGGQPVTRWRNIAVCEGFESKK